MTWTTVSSAVNGFSYDTAGDVTSDNQNSYAYDAQGRLCAVGVLISKWTYTQYIYDAEGRRVGKGSVPNHSCGAPTTANSFSLSNQYLLGQGGEQVTEINGSGTLLHTNAYVGGTLLATYDFSKLNMHFILTDPLGTKRVQISGSGQPELNCLSLPFGNDLGNLMSADCIPAPGAVALASDATEHHFTGKERDSESGNDYFSARYYGSSMGRFLSPDPSGATAVNPSFPQSWNMYVYAANNPLRYTDPTGLDCVYYNDSGTGVESIDHHSDSGECKDNGGVWEEGTTYKSWQHYDKKSDTWNGASMDSKNVYFYQGVAPGESTITSTDWGGYSYQSNCSGNCFSNSNSISIGNLQGQLQNGATLYGLLSWAVSQGPGGFGYGNPNWVGGAQHDWIDGNGNNWCGAGGAGVPSSGGDFGCLAHDYNHVAIDAHWWPNNFDPSYSKGPQLQKVNQALCDNSGFEVRAFFTVFSAWGCR